MHIIFRFIRGGVVGFELTPAEGIYLVLYLGVAEVGFVNRDFFNSVLEED